MSDTAEKTTIVISDIHLGWLKEDDNPSGGEVANRERLEDFLSYLDRHSEEFSLVINGDLPDLERTEPLDCLRQVYELFRGYKNLAGMEKHWVVGNHDNVLRDVLYDSPDLVEDLRKMKFEFHLKSYIVPGDGKRIVITHGDVLDFMFAFHKAGKRSVPDCGKLTIPLRLLSWVCRLPVICFMALWKCTADTAYEFHRFCYQEAQTSIEEYESFFKQPPLTVLKLIWDFTCSRFARDLLRPGGKLVFSLLGLLGAATSYVSDKLWSFCRIFLAVFSFLADFFVSAHGRNPSMRIPPRQPQACWIVAFFVTTISVVCSVVYFSRAVRGDTPSTLLAAIFPFMAGAFSWLAQHAYTVLPISTVAFSVALYFFVAPPPGGKMTRPAVLFLLASTALMIFGCTLIGETFPACGHHKLAGLACIAAGLVIIFTFVMALAVAGVLVFEGFVESFGVHGAIRKGKNLAYAVANYPNLIDEEAPTGLGRDNVHFIIGHTHYAEHSEKHHLTDTGAFEGERTFCLEKCPHHKPPPQGSSGERSPFCSLKSCDKKPIPRASYAVIKKGKVSLHNLYTRETCLEFVDHGGFDDYGPGIWREKEVPGSDWVLIP